MRTGLERMTVHDLRHTAASLAISSGANVKAVRRMLGHASVAMTLDVYADLFDDDLDTVSASLNAAREASIAQAREPSESLPRHPSTGSSTKSVGQMGQSAFRRES